MHKLEVAGFYDGPGTIRARVVSSPNRDAKDLRGQEGVIFGTIVARDDGRLYADFLYGDRLQFGAWVAEEDFEIVNDQRS